MSKADRASPPAGRWTIDREHTRIGFVARRLLLQKVRGAFDQFDGAVTIANRLEQSTVSATIEVASINTNDSLKDKHLSGAEFFDAHRFPQMTFASTALKVVSPSVWKLTGGLTIKDVTRPVNLDVKYQGVTTSRGQTLARFHGTSEINREEWGLRWNDAIEAGGILVGPIVKIELDVTLISAG